MTKVTFYGGVDEIGGNKIVIEDKDARIILDFGMSISSRSRFFSDPYVSPRRKESLLELGIIPNIKGLYSWENEAAVDAVFLSHAHLDHYGYLSMINRGISVYCGETTKLIMGAITETRRATFESDYRGIEYKTFRTGSKVRIGSISVSAVHVDHSIPGAYGFIVETASGRIIYTGDLRAHGRNADLTADFVKSASSDESEFLLTEATNMVGGVVSSEQEISGKLLNVTQRATGLVMASFSTMDADRLVSFYNAAKSTERRLVLSPKQAFLLSTLADDPILNLPGLDDATIAIYKRSKKRFEDWEEEICAKGEVLTSSDLMSEQSRCILAASLSDMEGMVDVKPQSGSVYILSSSEPFNEEMELDMQRLIEWLNFYGMPLYHIHVSGHIMPQDLKGLVAKIRAKYTSPIHTEHPELFSKFMKNKDRITIPKPNQSIDI